MMGTEKKNLIHKLYPLGLDDVFCPKGIDCSQPHISCPWSND